MTTTPSKRSQNPAKGVAMGAVFAVALALVIVIAAVYDAPTSVNVLMAVVLLALGVVFYFTSRKSRRAG